MNPILNSLKEARRLELTILLSLMSLFCASLVAFRIAHSGSFKYAFMCWNLFLAAVPWMLSTWVVMHEGLRRRPSAFWLVLFTWLLFFPNAPYIITDMIHLRTRHGMPEWFDVMLIQSFAWTGLAFGFTSLHDIENLLRRRFSPRVTDAAVVTILFLSGFGVYLGRYPRWNSWDLVSRPLSLLADVLDRFVDPLAHSRTWGMTVLIGVLLNMMYWTIRFLKKHYDATEAMPERLGTPAARGTAFLR